MERQILNRKLFPMKGYGQVTVQGIRRNELVYSILYFNIKLYARY